MLTVSMSHTCKFLKNPFVLHRSELEEHEIEILDDIRKCSKSVEKSTIETTAYLRALGESKGLNIAKYRDEVKREIENDNKPKTSGIFDKIPNWLQ